ncbi:MAG: N-acetylglucosamine-6-phosphate deacetylase [Anaerolineae bacterium]|nr:N-acetylglucosamine-6-phosphate deacetylase [Anaerolineae bacterium]
MTERLRVIINGRVYTPEGVIEQGVVTVVGDKIAAAGETTPLLPDLTAAKVIDAAGLHVLPGLIDLHIHGLGGFDAMQGQVAEMAAELPRHGVTAFLPTTIAAPLAELAELLEGMAATIAARPPGARILGMHLEGPFLSPRQTGMMDARFLRPFRWEEFEPLQAASRGWLKMMTLAPEEGEALSAIPRLLEQGVLPSIGHSDATFEQVRAAVQQGLAHATHIYNAMHGFHHREPGVVGAVWYSDEVIAQVIADGVHVHPAALALLLRLKTPERVALISDAAPIAGLPPGEYTWGGKQVILEGQTCRSLDGRLAGSVALMDAGLRTLVQTVGLPLERALVMATAVPAGVLSLNKGALAPGRDADIVLLDDALQPQWTMIEGQVVYDALPGR